MVKKDRKVNTDRTIKAQAKKKKSFSSQKVELKDFAPVPEGWEYFVYAFYTVAIPYILGAVFLFFCCCWRKIRELNVVKHGCFSNCMAYWI